MYTSRETAPSTIINTVCRYTNELVKIELEKEREKRKHTYSDAETSNV